MLWNVHKVKNKKSQMFLTPKFVLITLNKTNSKPRASCLSWFYYSPVIVYALWVEALWAKNTSAHEEVKIVCYVKDA